MVDGGLTSPSSEFWKAADPHTTRVVKFPSQVAFLLKLIVNLKLPSLLLVLKLRELDGQCRG